MNLKCSKIVFAAILVVSVVAVVPHKVEAVEKSTEELLSQLQDLIKQVSILQDEIRERQNDDISDRAGIAPVPFISSTAASARPLKSDACYSFRYNLYLGVSDRDSGGEVTKLQRFLARDSSIYPEGLVTGFFGPLTERAVKRWQAKHKVVSSGGADTTGYGVVGPKTKTKIASVCSAASAAGGEFMPVRSVAAVRSNLLEDPGFEGNYLTSNSWMADSWIGGCRFTFDGSIARTGSKSARIQCKNPNDARWIQTISVQPDTNYVFSGWIKTKNIARTAETADIGANLSVMDFFAHSSGILKTNGWTFQKFQFNSGNRTSIRVGARLGYWGGTTSGTAWFDDLKLEGPAGSVPISPPAPPALSSMPPIPPLLSFGESITAPSGTQPSGLAWDGDYLWLSSYMRSPGIYKLDSSNGSVLSKCVPPTAQYNGYDGLTFDGTYIWQADGYGGGIYKLDPADCSVLQKIPSPDSYPSDLAWDGTYLWVAGYPTQQLYKIRPSDGSVVTQFRVPAGVGQAQIAGLVYINSSLWLSSTNQIIEINPVNGQVLSSIPTTITRPDSLAWDGKYLWAASFDKAKIYRLNINTGTASSSMPDLRVAISTSGSAEAGEDLLVPVTVSNTGGAIAYGTAGSESNGYMVDVILSTDAFVPDRWAAFSLNYKEDVMLRGGRISNTSNLFPNGEKTFSYSYDIPTDTPAGSYYICARIDPGHKVAELDENNNSACIQVQVSSSVTLDDVTIPSPQLIYRGTEDYNANGREWTRYMLGISNQSLYPDELFAPAPDLPPCGLNKNSARTWVNVIDASNDSYIYGFCGLGKASNLNDIWFAVERGAAPPEAVYVKFIDRKSGRTYISNKLLIPGGVSNTVLPDLSVKSAEFTDFGVKATFCNNSSQNLSGFPVNIKLNDALRAFDLAGPRRANVCQTHTWAYDVWGHTYSPAISYQATIAADPYNAIKETNENNNTVNMSKQGASVASLAVTYPNTGETFTVGSKIPIQWAGGGSDWKMNVILIDKTKTKTVKYIVLSSPNDGKQDWTVTPDIPYGDYYMRVACQGCAPATVRWIDDSNVPFSIKPAVASSNEPVYDLEVKNLKGTDFGVSVELCNAGSTVVKSFPVQIVANGITKKFPFPVTNFEPGACSPNAWQYSMWNMQPGQTYLVSAAANYDNSIKEENIGNNALSVNIRVPGQSSGGNAASAVSFSSAQATASVLGGINGILANISSLLDQLRIE